MGAQVWDPRNLFFLRSSVRSTSLFEMSRSASTFDSIKKEYRLHEDIIRFLTATEPAGLGLESLSDFAELFTSESEVQSIVLDRVPMVKTSAVQASRLRQAWRGVQQSDRICEEEPCKR